MPACPACGTETPGNATRCARCGADLTRASGSIVDELELAIPTTRKEASVPGLVAAPARGAPAAPKRPPGAGDLDLDLSTGSVAQLPPSLRGGAATGLRLGANGQLLARAPASRPGAGARPGLDEDGLDPYEIRAYADYGDPPEAFYLAPLYALRVHKRRKELMAELDTRMGAVKEITDRIEDAVIAFGERVRPIAAENPVYMRAVAPIDEAERLLRTRDAGLAGEVQAYEATARSVDAKLNELEAKLHRIEQSAAALEAELERLEDQKKRAEARAKRADMERRNAERGIAAGEGSGSSLTIHAKEKIAERDAELAKVRELAPLVAEHLKKLEGPRAERAVVEKAIAEARRERQAASERLRRQTGTREAGAADARARVRAAVADFARTALTDAKTFGGEFDASRRAIESLLLEREEKERAVLTVEKAIRSADEAAVRRGIVVFVGGALGMLLLVLGLPIYRAIFPPKAPPLYPTDE